MSYLEYRNFALEFDEVERTLSLFRVSGRGYLECFLEKAGLIVKGFDKQSFSAKAYSECKVTPLPDVRFSRPENNLFWEYQVDLSGGQGGLPEVAFSLAIHGDHILLSALKGSVLLRGVFRNGRDARSRNPSGGNAPEKCIRRYRSDSLHGNPPVSQEHSI